MTAITITNTEGTIITRLKEALEGATLDGPAVFARVTAATSAAQIEQTMFKGTTPYCGILATMGEERAGVPNRRDIVLELELYIAHKCPSKIDETAKTIEKFRLANLAKNAVEAATRVNALATGIPDEDNFHRPGPIWGPMSDAETESAKPPWIAIILPLTYGFPIDGSTSH